MQKRRALILTILVVLIAVFFYPNVCKKGDIKVEHQETKEDSTLQQESLSDEPTQFVQSKVITVPNVWEMRKQQEREVAQLIEQIYCERVSPRQIVR